MSILDQITGTKRAKKVAVPAKEIAPLRLMMNDPRAPADAVEVIGKEKPAKPPRPLIKTEPKATREVRYGVYELAEGEGPRFIVRPTVDRHERLLFTGDDKERVLSDACAWVDKNFGASTPRAKKED